MDIEEIILHALKEDTGGGDFTSMATIPAAAMGRARLLVKEDGILCGMEIAEKVFHTVDDHIIFSHFLTDGTAVKPGDIAFTVSGKAISLLAAERVALNFLQRMSGIATATHRFVKELEGTKARILDTRKTTPLLRELEKYAVRTGGGHNHRMGLYDMIMIKDNHVDFSGGIREAIHSAQEFLRKENKNLKSEIEVRNFDELEKVLETGGIDRIMLDNFSPADLAEAVGKIGGQYETEASGGITLQNIREYALTGVDFISVGALTHHIKSLDMSLKAF